MSNLESFDEDKLEKLLTAYKSEKRLMIRNLLTIYKELSLTELSENMQMSKTAVHHHLKILRETGIVEVSREEEARGSIDRKYFQLVKGSWNFKVEDLAQITDLQRRYQFMASMLNTLQVVYQELTYRMELMINLTEYLNDKLDILDQNNLTKTELDRIETQLLENNTHLSNIPLGKKQYKEFLQLKLDFIEKVNEMKDNIPEEDSPYLGILVDMPIQSLLEFNIDQL